MSDFLTRMIEEEKQLFEKCRKINIVIGGVKPKSFDDTDWELLKDQARYMACYGYTLKSRISYAQSKQKAKEVDDEKANTAANC